MKVCVWILALAAVAAAANPVEDLRQRIDSGAVHLEYRQPRGYLDALLEALDISPLTQTLVFSKTSAQFRLISPRSPRALYFNDDVYVGWVRDGPFIEISTADSVSGASFYTIAQDSSTPARPTPDTGQCLQCHESGRTLGIPGHLTRSVHPAADGQPFFQLGTIDVSQRTPVSERFGGWYVTGDVIEHWGNRVLPDAKTPQAAESRDLSTVINLDEYLAADSDIVAHLLLVHQTQTHNYIARAALEARKAITYRDEAMSRYGGSDEMLQSVKRRIERPAEDLLESLLFAGEAKLPNPIRERSPLSEAFSRRGPLYELDLQTRLLQTPISYLILSDAFDSLPNETLDYLGSRLQVILKGEDATGRFQYLTPSDRAAVQQLIKRWKPSLLDRGVR
ncbi:MAG: hypothetical protein WD733_22360 [Bryobacterales bacterium]